MQAAGSVRAADTREHFTGYAQFLGAVRDRIRAAQVQATLAANAELIRLYWDIGKAIVAAQQSRGWGSGVIPLLAADLRHEIPDVRGFSVRNLGRMAAFFREYPELWPESPVLPTPLAKSAGGEPEPILPTALAKSGKLVPMLPELLSAVPWAHHVLLIQRVKALPARRWYMEQILANGWSHDMLDFQLDGQAWERSGSAITNFSSTLPPAQSDLARQVLKDPYIFDFLTLAQPFRERELESALLGEVQRFLLELGQGFAFVGRQHRMEVGGEDFYIDLLFYHLRLRCYVVIDLKRGPFKAEYAGKMNFYCQAVDGLLRHADDQPTIGLILCQDKNRIIAEYALKGLQKAIGISAYKLTRALPKEFRSSLPTVEQMETRLAEMTQPDRKEASSRKKRRTKP